MLWQDLPEDDVMGEGVPDDEEEGEDLFGNDMMDDYRADPALDEYDTWTLGRAETGNSENSEILMLLYERASQIFDWL